MAITANIIPAPAAALENASRQSSLQTALEKYVLGNSTHEQERLKAQAKFLEKWTENFLLSAGLQPGMHVLDLGCGMGDVSILAARLIGETGSVTGLDRDGVVLEKARERVCTNKRCARIEFIQSDFFEFQGDWQFDAVVGRYFLLYQSDPAAAIAHAAKQVRPGGVVVFHEVDFGNAVRSYPDGTLFTRLQALIAETFRRAGFWPDLGLHLTHMFLDAGLPWPSVKAEAPVGGEPGSYLYRWITETVRSLLPRIQQFGLATAEELDLETLITRMEAEAVARRTQLVGPLQFAAWIRNP